MRTQFAKIALAVLGFAITIFLACSDYPALNFPSEAEVNQRYSSGGVVCDDADKCNGECYDRGTQFCSSNTIYKMCNSNPYNVQDNICCGNALYLKSSYACCGETAYLLLNYGCLENKVLTKCGSDLYDPTKEFCTSKNEVYPLCGDKTYDPPEQSCAMESGKPVVKGECNKNPINFTTHFCFDGEPHLLCGGRTYNPRNQFCFGIKFYDKCNDAIYSPSTDFCYGEKTYPLCDGLDYNPTDEFCYEGVIKSKCGGTLEYNPTTHYCNVSDGKTYSCGNKPYNPITHYCYELTGKAYSCGNKPYDPVTEFCHTDGKTYSCGGNGKPKKPLNPATHYCVNGDILSCGGKSLDPATQFCYQSTTVVNYCGINRQVYDPDLYECKPSSNGIYLKGGITDTRDSKKYNAVLIGTQVWMAENMNYKTTSGSGCLTPQQYNQFTLSDNDNTNCTNSDGTTNYGRLYNWTTATTMNVCPGGWHIPSDADWKTLIQYVKPNCSSSSSCPSSNIEVDYNYLCNCTVTMLMGSSWPSGTDDYGFKALPSASCMSGYCESNISKWWSSLDVPNWNSGAYILSIGSSNSEWGKISKDNFLSVRCLKDN